MASDVKLLYSYGGELLPRPFDGVLSYVGGETRLATVSRSSTLPEILGKMAEGPVGLRYQLPGADLGVLVSVATDDDVENMMEEYDALVAGDSNAKLRVVLFDGAGRDSGPAVARFSSAAAEVVFGGCVPSTAPSSGDASSLYFGGQVDAYPQSETDSCEQNQILGSTLSEFPPRPPLPPPHMEAATEAPPSSGDASKLDFEGRDDPYPLPKADSSHQNQILGSSPPEFPPQPPPHWLVPHVKQGMQKTEIPVPSQESKDTGRAASFCYVKWRGTRVAIRRINDLVISWIPSAQAMSISRMGAGTTAAAAEAVFDCREDTSNVQVDQEGKVSSFFYVKWRCKRVAIKRLNDLVFSWEPSEQAISASFAGDLLPKLFFPQHLNVCL